MKGMYDGLLYNTGTVQYHICSYSHMQPVECILSYDSFLSLAPSTPSSPRRFRIREDQVVRKRYILGPTHAFRTVPFYFTETPRSVSRPRRSRTTVVGYSILNWITTTHVSQPFFITLADATSLNAPKARNVT